MAMTTYYLKLLYRGPTWTAEESLELERLQEAHLANNRRLAEMGKQVISGPCTDGSDLRGVSILKVASLEEAQALAATDPSVQAGRLRFELHPWMVEEGILP
jgi:uncharacterized protein YciI